MRAPAGISAGAAIVSRGLVWGLVLRCAAGWGGPKLRGVGRWIGDVGGEEACLSQSAGITHAAGTSGVIGLIA